MKNTKSIFSHLIILLFFLLAACSTTTDPAESYKDETAEQIFKHGEDALRDKNYAEAIKRFEALDVQYPFGRNTEIAQLHLIYAYYMNGDYPSAESAADRFVHAHPTNPHVDYAYYMRGVSNYYQNMGVFERLFAVDFSTRDLSQVKKSFNDFDELTKQYPDSRYTPPAHQYMIYLRNVLAAHQLEVAKYYYDRGAYVASANRAALVVQHYQEVPVIPDALVMMAKSYHKLGMVSQQNQAIEVLKYNYPDPRYLDQVSDKAMGVRHYEIVTPLEKPEAVPPKVNVAPPQQVADQHRIADGNGFRGQTDTTLAQVVNQMDKLKGSLVAPASVPATATTTAAVNASSKPADASAPSVPAAPVQQAMNTVRVIPGNGGR